MATLTIEVSDEAKRRMDLRAKESGYTGSEELLRALVEGALELPPLSAEFEAELVKALDSPGRVMTAADWEEKMRQLEEWHARTHR
jgi:predicted transcriptional regulator